MILTNNNSSSSSNNNNSSNGTSSNENHTAAAGSNKSKETIDDWTQDLTRYFDLKYAKHVTVLLISLFIFYHGYLNSFYGRNSCNKLLDEGHFLGNNEWQPYGCMIHKYDKNDIETCFKYVKYYNGKNRFVFIGDSRMRQIYRSFIKKLDKSVVNSPRTLNNAVNENLNYTNRNLNLDAFFIWKPILDDSLSSIIESYLQPNAQKPSFIIIGMGTAYLKTNSSKESLDSFRRNLTSLVENIKTITIDTKSSILAAASRLNNEPVSVQSGSAGNSNNNNPNMNAYSTPSSLSSWSSQSSPIYWMLQDPIDEYKYLFNKSINEQITNKQIDLYNRAAISILHYSPVNIWSSSRLVSQGYNKDSVDGLLIGPFALEIDSQILFNLHCNNRMNFNDASCCSQPESVSLIQQILFSFFFICFAVMGFLLMYRNFCKKFSKFRLNISGSEISLAASCKTAASSVGAYTVLKSISKLALIVFYFYACDRANYFMKENKHFTVLTFGIPFMYVSVLGLFFHDNSPGSKAMSRHQTEELKGFMQFVILIYKLSDAQQNTPLFFFVRLITSGYLFLSGFGHFMYYWKTSNYGITRFFEVLFRLNFLPVILCFSMNRMYQFYEFISMITFWYVCSYILMVVYPRVSAKSAKDHPQHYFYMIIKLALFAGIITTLNMSEVLFEKIFIARPWKFLFVNYDDLISGWRLRWSLDCYSFLFGMVFALLLCILKRCSVLEMDHDYESTERRRELRVVPFFVKFLLVLLSLAGLISYAIFAALCQNRDECNKYTTYISIIPILSYLILRNTIDCIRDKCSYMFSWFGRISLELYICSSHIWMAADSNGLLVLLPGYPVVNMLITTFIFICLAHELNLITKMLSSYFVPNNWRICLRNFFTFIILLMPIAIKNGYI